MQAQPNHQEGAEIIYAEFDQGDQEAADLLLDDCWTVPRYEVACLDGLPSWDEDPYDENYWRLQFYGLRPTAHLLWAYRETGDTVYRDKLLAILDSYLDHVELAPMDEPLWHIYTTAFRAMVLVNTYFKLDQSGDLDDSMARRLRGNIERIGAWLADESHFNDDYNHGFTEAAALLLIGHNFSGGSAGCGQPWTDIAIERIENLMVDVVGPDGVEIEQSPYYHVYVLTFVWAIGQWAQQHDVALSEDYAQRLDDMVYYATLVATPDTQIPLIGSSIQRDLVNNTPWVMEEIAEQYPTFRWVRTMGLQGEEPTDTAVLFPDAGEFIARSGFGPTDEVLDQTHLIFDVGPYRTDHSHLDALALHVYAAGRTLLPDSGLYSYEDSDLRDYFVGTSAHNTVVVDGGDQDAGEAESIRSVTGDGWIYHAGTHRLYAEVEHRRGVLLLDRQWLLVIDQLSAAQAHDYTQTWHLFPGASVEADAAVTVVRDQDDQPVLRLIQGLTDGVTSAAMCGSDDPLQGWYSADYEVLVANGALEYDVTGDDVTLVTLLVLGDAAGEETQLSVVEGAETGPLTVSIDDGTDLVTVVIDEPLTGEDVVHVQW